MEVLEILVDQEKEERIDSFLSKKLEFTRNRIQQLIKDKNIKVNNKDVKSSYKIQWEDKIEIVVPEIQEVEIVPENIPINIVYEDKDIAIINKQCGLVVHPAQGHNSGTLVNAILYHIGDLSGINGENRPGIVHRLDKDTSGLIIVAKNDKSHGELVNMFQNREIKKTYLAIVKGKIKEKKARIVTQMARDSKDRKKMMVVTGINQGKTAITNYEVIDENDKFSLLKLRIETGRTHQIRVHMKYMGHPIFGDDVYGKGEKNKRQMLHAYNLKFNHPITKEKMDIIGNLPEDFLKSLKSCGLEFIKE